MRISQTLKVQNFLNDTLTPNYPFSAHNINNGMGIADLQKILGHKKKETTLKYIHVVNSSLRDTMLKTQA